MGETCGILPVGVENAMVKTEGLKWNLGALLLGLASLTRLDWVTSFDGEISTSNHLVPSEPVVFISTSRAILWCIEVKSSLPRVTSRSKKTVSIVEDLSRGMRDLGKSVVAAATL